MYFCDVVLVGAVLGDSEPVDRLGLIVIEKGDLDSESWIGVVRELFG